MKDKDIKWDDIKSVDKKTGLFRRYCFLNSCCENCNKKVRFWCILKDRITDHQQKIITRLLDNRAKESDNE